MTIHKNHPKGLFLLFFVEMWERFSYYGMRALLVLYMVHFLMFTHEKAVHIYGWYTGMVYLTPLLGGYIADRYLGQRASILLGGTLMALGHFAMALPSLPFFFGAMMLLIMGNGFFKPNISTIVGKLYEENDPRRDAGFTIFYMGINLGAMFSPFVCSTLGEMVGWHWGFGAAGVGMVLGLAMYMWGQKALLGEHGLKPAKPQGSYWVPVSLTALMALLLTANSLEFNGFTVFGLLPRWAYALLGVLVLTGAAYAYAGHPEKSSLTRVEKQRIAVIFIMLFFSTFFWTAFEQAGSSLTLFADSATNRNLLLFGRHFLVPAGWFQSLNPFYIVVLAPLFSRMWMDLGEKNREPSSPIKFAMGLGLLAVGFVVMVAAAASYQKYGPVSMVWLAAVYLFHTLGELCLSPVGLSLVTKLAPAQFGSLLMGTWFLSSSAAGFFGGLFAGKYDTMSHTTFFLIPTATGLFSASLLLLMTPKIRKWMHGVH